MSAPGPIRKGEKSRSDWETPAGFFELVHRKFNFTVDAAASRENAKLPRYLTEENDALSFHLFNERVWCNPPYGRGASTGLEDWILKFRQWADEGSFVVALLPANTGSAWFGDLWAQADILEFLIGRIQFVGSTSSNPGDSVLAIFRPGPRVLHRAEAYGWYWKEELADLKRMSTDVQDIIAA